MCQTHTPHVMSQLSHPPPSFTFPFELKEEAKSSVSHMDKGYDEVQDKSLSIHSFILSLQNLLQIFVLFSHLFLLPFSQN